METKRATPREQFGQPEAGQTVKKVRQIDLQCDPTLLVDFDLDVQMSTGFGGRSES